MRRRFALLVPFACASLAVLPASVAAAAGLNFSWGDCGTFGAVNKSFACTSNTLAGAIMVGSFVPPAGTTSVTGEEIVVDLQSASPTVPPWWQFKYVGACRQTSLATSADFTSNVNCVDYWQGLAVGTSVTYVTPYHFTASRARLVIINALAPADAGPLSTGSEYYAFKVSLAGQKTVGTGACAGCLDPVCLVLNQIKITQPAGVGDFYVTATVQRNYVTWQGGVVATGCPVATPTHNATWGALKGLYR